MTPGYGQQVVTLSVAVVFILSVAHFCPASLQAQLPT